MPRKKKTEEVKEEKIIKESKPVDYGTGMTRKNNELMAFGKFIPQFEVKEEERNE